jgi:hypothetical protein
MSKETRNCCSISLIKVVKLRNSNIILLTKCSLHNGVLCLKFELNNIVFIKSQKELVLLTNMYQKMQ